ncbi:uncharacterized protein LOC111354749 [Spodoptera litura]|uniref:Uncharacterized protein LOC111354749 n=1 Tax=Spodoptera litura TaxID=69820 RepID=A0A9J7E6N4_SPOLT|nr:uncharacterized protein LOC111354749 [Spodoptera litura]
MEGMTHGARTRGLRRGRGVRVRLPVPAVVEVSRGGGVTGGSGGRGGRGSPGCRGGRGSRARPQGPNRLIIRDITEMPIGEGLETPLHPRRMRVWQPSRPQTAPTPAPTASAPCTPSGSSTMVSRESQSPVLVMPPSPAMFVECSLSGLSTPSGPSPVLEMPPSPAM